MPAWWDSLETVVALNCWVRWLSPGFTTAGAVCIILTLVLSKRIDTLKDKRDT